MSTKIAILFSILILSKITGFQAKNLESYDYEEAGTEDEAPEEANYDVVRENPKILGKYLRALKNKRELETPQDIANDLINNYDGIDKLQEEEQSTYNKLLNQLKQKFYDGGEYAMIMPSNSTGKLNASSGSSPGQINVPVPSTSKQPTKVNITDETECAKTIDPTNATSILERVLEELENIRMLKQGNSTPEGAPCDIEASWNSEMVGLRFQFNVTNNNVINVLLSDKIPQRHTYKIDKTWNCTGFSLNKIGGPFYLTCLKKPEAVLALFTGICKNCGGYNTIFGSWTFAHHPSDCQNLHTFIETKNDVFRHETLHLKKIQKMNRKDVIQQQGERAGNKTRRFASVYQNYDFK